MREELEKKIDKLDKKIEIKEMEIELILKKIDTSKEGPKKENLKSKLEIKQEKKSLHEATREDLLAQYVKQSESEGAITEPEVMLREYSSSSKEEWEYDLYSYPSDLTTEETKEIMEEIAALKEAMKSSFDTRINGMMEEIHHNEKLSRFYDTFYQALHTPFMTFYESAFSNSGKNDFADDHAKLKKYGKGLGKNAALWAASTVVEHTIKGFVPFGNLGVTVADALWSETKKLISKRIDKKKFRQEKHAKDQVKAFRKILDLNKESKLDGCENWLRFFVAEFVLKYKDILSGLLTQEEKENLKTVEGWVFDGSWNITGNSKSDPSQKLAQKLTENILIGWFNNTDLKLKEDGKLEEMAEQLYKQGFVRKGFSFSRDVYWQSRRQLLYISLDGIVGYWDMEDAFKKFFNEETKGIAQKLENWTLVNEQDKERMTEAQSLVDELKTLIVENTQQSLVGENLEAVWQFEKVGFLGNFFTACSEPSFKTVIEGSSEGAAMQSACMPTIMWDIHQVLFSCISADEKLMTVCKMLDDHLGKGFSFSERNQECYEHWHDKLINFTNETRERKEIETSMISSSENSFQNDKESSMLTFNF